MTTMVGPDPDTDTTVVAGGSADNVSDDGGKKTPDSGSGSASGTAPSFATAAGTMDGSFTTAVDDVSPEDGWTTVGRGGAPGR